MIALPESVIEFCRERHVATLTTLRPDGSPHVVPVGFTLDPAAGLARVITDGASMKACNARRGGRAVLSQVQGRRWMSLEGLVHVEDSPVAVKDAEQRYAERYRVPRVNPQRVVLVIALDRMLGGTWGDRSSA